MAISTILVPRGAEYQSVYRGLQKAAEFRADLPTVVAIPMGIKPVKQFLMTLLQQNLIKAQSQILVMGLCGGLRADYQVGDVVAYESVVGLNQKKSGKCDAQLTETIRNQLTTQPPLVNAWTSEQFINSIQIKQQLGEAYGVDVVDMEGTAILTSLAAIKAKVAMLRVISDDCQHELPNLTAAISAQGKITPLPLLQAMIRQPRGSFRLIRGSVVGLQVLQQVTAQLFATENHH